jgi:hypothetical protein
MSAPDVNYSAPRLGGFGGGVGGGLGLGLPLGSPRPTSVDDRYVASTGDAQAQVQPEGPDDMAGHGKAGRPLAAQAPDISSLAPSASPLPPITSSGGKLIGWRFRSEHSR